MVDQEKIIIMTKLALYEKRYMRRDKRKLDFFIEDYIYIRNFISRFGVTLIFIFSIALGAFRILNKNIIFPTSLTCFLDVYIMPYFWPWLLAIIIYSVITTFVSGVAYKKASNRFNEYKKLMKQLEEHESHQAKNEGARNEI